MLKANITSCDEKSCDHQHNVIILRSAMLQLALSNLWGSGVILPINQHLHFLKENFVLLVSAAPLHLMIQLGDDLVLKLQLDGAGVNNQCS